MRSVGPGRGAAVVSLFAETGLDMGWQSLALEGLLGDFTDLHFSVGADDNEAAFLKYDVGLGRFQKVSGNAFTLLNKAIGGNADRSAAQHRRARAECADAHGNDVGIAITVIDEVGVDPEAVGQHLLECGAMSLAMIHGSGKDS